MNTKGRMGYPYRYSGLLWVGKLENLAVSGKPNFDFNTLFHAVIAIIRIMSYYSSSHAALQNVPEKKTKKQKTVFDYKS
jgi:hypothetical protein